MSEEITNEISPGEMKLEDRVENLYQESFKSIESLDNLFKKGGFLEQSVSKLGGDIAWFNDVRNALDNVYEQIEESHMGAVAHLKMKDESVEVSETPNKPGYCSDDCCGAEVKEEDCNCPPDCEGCDCNADVKEETIDPELAIILQRSGL